MEYVVDWHTDPTNDELSWRIDRLVDIGMEPEELQDGTTIESEQDNQFFIRGFLSYEETSNEAAKFSEDNFVKDTQDGSPEITPGFAGDENQEDEAHTPMSNDDRRNLCASSVDPGNHISNWGASLSDRRNFVDCAKPREENRSRDKIESF